MIKAFQSRSTFERLFEPVDADSDGFGLVSAYTQFEAQRFNLHQSRDLVGSFQDRLDTLHWYLISYSHHRKGSVPLSASQIAFLNAPAPVLGLKAPLSVAALSFMMNEREQPLSAITRSTFRELCYWWCIVRSAQISFNDCLVTPAMRIELTKPLDGQGHLEFGLNNFLAEYRNAAPELAELRPAHRDDRVVLLMHAIAAAAADTRLVRYLPLESTRRLLSSARPGSLSMFETLLDFGVKGAAFEAEFSGRRLQDFLEGRWAGAGRRLDGGRQKSAVDAQAGIEAWAPRDMQLDRVEQGVCLIGPLGAASGLGQATRISAHVLSEGDLPLSVIDFSWDNPAPTGYSEARHYSSPTRPASINLIHLNAESLPTALARFDPRLYETSYNIGYFFWELSELPACHQLALNVLDEIWVASEYNRQVYEQAAPGIPVTNVGMAVEPLSSFRRRSRSYFNLPTDSVLFLTTFDSFSFIERKNPLGAVAAFQAAFPPERGEAVNLVIKTQNRHRVLDPHQVRIWSKIDHAISLDPRIILINETLHYEDLMALKACCDSYVSLHRSEGLGFGMIESMQLRMPVIATGYGGNMDFMDRSTACLVDYKLISVVRGEYIFVEPGSLWAEPDVIQAADWMRRLYDDPALRRRIGDDAAKLIQDSFSVEAIRKRYLGRLNEIEQIIKDRVDVHQV